MSAAARSGAAEGAAGRTGMVVLGEDEAVRRSAADTQPLADPRTGPSAADGVVGDPFPPHGAYPASGVAAANDGVGRYERSFRVRLDNFDGPFDLLLQLISAQRMDVTDIALHRVTDDFIEHIRSMGTEWDLDQATEFLVVAATLLDLKAARLLPGSGDEGGSDLALLESRDLLFARLLAYRAYQQVAALFAELQATALHRYPRAVALEDRYLGLLPEVRIGMSPAAFAALAAEVFAPKPPPPQVSVDHLHSTPESVAEHTAAMRRLLSAAGRATFTELVAECTSVIQVVARFLGLLNLYRSGSVLFDQDEPMALLTVRWTGTDPGPRGGAPDNARGPENDEEYG
jgi:segregation and condensation protein A